MKKLKRLTVNQIKFLTKEGFKPEDYLLERATAEEFVFFNKHTGMLVPIRR